MTLTTESLLLVAVILTSHNIATLAGRKVRNGPEKLSQLLDPSPDSNSTQPDYLLSVYSRQLPENVQVECKELRSKRYISDGYCTSIKPLTEVVCTGHCLPIRTLPWYAEFVKVWARTKTLEWRCVNDVVRRKRVTLLCENGETRSYKLKTVKSCKCKRYKRQHNRSRLQRPVKRASKSSIENGDQP